MNWKYCILITFDFSEFDNRIPMVNKFPFLAQDDIFLIFNFHFFLLLSLKDESPQELILVLSRKVSKTRRYQAPLGYSDKVIHFKVKSQHLNVKPLLLMLVLGYLVASRTTLPTLQLSVVPVWLTSTLPVVPLMGTVSPCGFPPVCAPLLVKW